jgi:STE24 endopeptidase
VSGDVVVDRRGAWLTLIALGVVFVAMAAALIPWDVVGTDVPRPAPESFFTEDEIARSEAFHDAIKWPGWLSLIAGLVAAALLGFSPVGRSVLDSVRRRVRRWWLQVVVLVVVAMVLLRLVTLPFSIWARTITLDYGLSTNSWAEWVWDVAKALGISMLLTTVGMLTLVWVARRFPRRWYLPAAGGAALLVVMLSFLYPVVFEPVFNKFTPMQEGALRSRLVQLAAEDGIQVSDVLVADASRRTTALNAYVSGFGATKRIVVYDNLVADAPPEEVELIVAHELSHAKHGDVVIGTVMGATGAGIAMVLLYLILSSDRVRKPLRIRVPSEPGVVLIVLALSSFAGLVSAPIQNTLSRQVEARADAHSLALTGDPDTFIAMQHRLAITNISHLEPDPILSFWFGSHPTTMDRIGMAYAFGVQPPTEGSR